MLKTFKTLKNLSSFDQRENVLILKFVESLREKSKMDIFTEEKFKSRSYGDSGYGYFVVFSSLFKADWYRIQKTQGILCIQSLDSNSLVEKWNFVGTLESQQGFDQCVAILCNKYTTRHTLRKDILDEVSEPFFSDGIYPFERLKTLSITTDLIFKNFGKKIEDSLNISVRFSDMGDLGRLPCDNKGYFYWDKNRYESKGFQVHDLNPQIYLSYTNDDSYSFLGEITNESAFKNTLDRVSNLIRQQQQ